MFVDINIKPSQWAINLVKTRIVEVQSKLTNKDLTYDTVALITYYKEKVLRYSKFTRLKQFIFMKVIIPTNYQVQKVLLTMQISIWGFDWTYQLYYY